MVYTRHRDCGGVRIAGLPAWVGALSGHPVLGDPLHLAPPRYRHPQRPLPTPGVRRLGDLGDPLSRLSLTAVPSRMPTRTRTAVEEPILAPFAPSTGALGRMPGSRALPSRLRPLAPY